MGRVAGSGLSFGLPNPEGSRSAGASFGALALLQRERTLAVVQRPRIIRRLSDEATTEETCVVRRFNAPSRPPPSGILPSSAADRPTPRVSRTFDAFNYRRRSLVSPVADFAAA
jgi:hypothetical protein